MWPQMVRDLQGVAGVITPSRTLTIDLFQLGITSYYIPNFHDYPRI